MDKENSVFGDELKSIDEEVSSDVDKILKLAKYQSKSKTNPIPNDESAENSTIPRGANDRSHSRSRTISPEQTKELRENVTTRLTLETNERLTEAALRQKLSKRKPDSRQDIIEAAVIDWLKRNISSK